jgi:hypothetical protein
MWRSRVRPHRMSATSWVIVSSAGLLCTCKTDISVSLCTKTHIGETSVVLLLGLREAAGVHERDLRGILLRCSTLNPHISGSAKLHPCCINVGQVKEPYLHQRIQDDILTYTSNVICSRQKLKIPQSVRAIERRMHCSLRRIMLVAFLGEQPYASADTVYDNCKGRLSSGSVLCKLMADQRQLVVDVTSCD